MTSMKRPSRGERESATTTRYAGRRLEPMRRSRIDTDTCSPPQRGKAGQALEAAELSLHAFELFHHLPKLRVLLEEPVHVLHGGAAAARDALATRTADDFRMRPLPGRHRRDDRVEPVEVLLLTREVADPALHHLAEARDHAEDLVERPHLPHLLELLAEVLQREAVLAELPHHVLGRLLIDGRLRLLHEGEDVTHAEDARGETVGVERLERVRLLAYADECDRAPRHLAHRERGATARVAVHLGEDESVDADGGVELLGHRHGVLPRHRVDDEQDVMGLQLAADRFDFVEHRLVDVQAACGIEDERREAARRSFLARLLADLEWLQ